MDDELSDAIAVVGLAGRFPGAPDIGAFWDLLRDGRSAVQALDDEQLRCAGVAPEASRGPGYVRAAALLDGIDLFDAEFFGYTAQQAVELDPQHRLFLEAAWRALEDAGCDPARVEGGVGVFAGSGANRYHLLVPPPGDPIGVYARSLAADKDFLTTRVSYKLDLRGPSLAVQTACSSSLVAVHVACQNLLLQECDLALAGGVSLQIPQGAGYPWFEGGILAPDGRCRAFDADARGTVPGSGVGVVALERLDEALRNRRRIYAVIRGSAVNNDGTDKIGFTAPSVHGQLQALRIAHAGLDTRELGLIEAHGTGTELGDAIELRAIGRLLGEPGPEGPYCALGSVKSNIGHLDAAAGVAGLIKAVLCLHHETIAPTLHVSRPTAVMSQAPALRLATEAHAWPRTTRRRRAAVSSFGIGGTNAHVVIEEAPRVVETPATSGPWLFPFSAISEEALDALRADVADQLSARPEVRLADVAYTLQRGRKAFPVRHVVVAADSDELIRALLGPRFGRTTAPTGRFCLVLSRDGGPAVALAHALGGAPGQGPARRKGLGAWLSGERDNAEVFDAHLQLARRLGAIVPGLNTVVGFGVGRLAAAVLSGALAEAEARAIAGGAGPQAFSPPEISAAGWTRFDPDTGEDAIGEVTASMRGRDSAQHERRIVAQLAGKGLRMLRLGETVVTDAHAGRRRLLELVGELWEGGCAVEWEALEADGRLTGLPGHPQRRRRHWPEKAQGAVAERRDGRLPEAQWFNAPVWRALPRTTATGSMPDAIVVIGRNEQAVAALAERLSGAGIHAEAWIGVSFDTPEGLAARLSAFAATGRRPRVVLFAEAAGIVPGEGSHDLLAPCGDALVVIQACAAAFAEPPAADLRIVVCNRAPPVEAANGPVAAAIAGLVAVVHGETSSTRIAVLEVDMAPDGSCADTAALAAALLAPATPGVVCLRNGRRFVRSSIRLELPMAPPPRTGGVHLVSGGFGRIGLALAEHLAATRGAKIILLGRRAPPRREDWPVMMSGARSETPFAVRLRRLEALEASAAGLHFAEADVSDAAALSQAVRQAEAALGPVTDVYHLAADLTEPSARAPVASLSPRAFRTQARAKLGGLCRLDDLFADRQLQTAVVFSSTSAWLGGAGLGAYAAANGAVDALVAGERDLRLPWISVAWDGWSDGGAVQHDTSITPPEGLVALERILAARPGSHVIVSKNPLDARLDARDRAETRRARPRTGQPRPDIATPFAAPRTDLERRVVEIWEAALGLEGLGVNDSLFELGGDSLAAMTILAAVREAFEIEVPLRAFIEVAPTIHHVCLAIVNELAVQSGDEAPFDDLMST